jgi:putative peptidoglycan lipid II flippase
MSESRVVARRAGLVALGTFASRVLGMARDAVVAAAYPVAATDAFWIAFTIPNTLRVVLGEGAVSNAFLPVFSDVRTRQGDTAARSFLSRFTGSLLCLLALACGLGIIAAPLLSLGYAGGLAGQDPERFALVVSLTRWLFPFLGLVGLSALATGVLNVLGRFTLPAFSPALFNLAMIVAPFTLLPLLTPLGLSPIFALALGALLGGVLQLLVLLPALLRAGMLPRPSFAPRDPVVRRALGLMGPLLLGLGVYQLNMLLSRLFASFLPEGSVSFLGYGMRVVEVPQGMFALALASATLPTLVKLRSEDRHADMLALFRDALRMTLLIGLPASVALYVLAEPTAAVLLGRGKFRPHEVIETGRSLSVQALGIWAVASVRAVVPMFAAHEDTRTPVRASFANLLVFLSLSLALMPALDHVAIALANSAAAVVQVTLLLYFLRKHTGPLGLRALALSTLRVLAACSLMALVLELGRRQYAFVSPGHELTRLIWYLGLCGAGALTFLVAARLFRVSELTALESAVRRRLRRAT